MPSAAAPCINNGGFVRLGSAAEGNTGSQQFYSGATVMVNVGGMFDTYGMSDDPGTISLAGTGIGGAGALVNSQAGVSTLSTGTVNLQTNATIGVTQAAGAIRITGLVRDGAINGISAASFGNSLTKIGSGLLAINGASTYTGATNVNAGTFLVNGNASAATGIVTVANTAALGGTGTIGGAVVLNSGSVLAPGDPATSSGVGALTVANNFTAQSGSTFNYEFASTSSYDQLKVTGASNTVTINGNGFELYNPGVTTPFFTPGTYQLIQYAGALSGNVGSLNVLNPQVGRTYSFNTTSNAGWIDLVIGTSGLTSTWTGGTSATWADGTELEHESRRSGRHDRHHQPRHRRFNASPTNPVPTIDSGRNILGINFDTASVGALTLGTTGGNALLLSNGGQIQTTATVANPETVNAPLVLEGGAGAAYFFTSNAPLAANTLNFGGGITSAAGGTTTLTLAGSNTGNNTVSGNIADVSTAHIALVKTGTGTWVLTGANSYSGGTTINGGTLQINGDGALGAVPAVEAVNLTFGGSATLQAGVRPLPSAASATSRLVERAPPLSTPTAIPCRLPASSAAPPARCPRSMAAR